MFCAPGLVFGGTEGAASHFHVLRSRTRFQRCRGRRFPFSCFARLDSFSALPWASGPVSTFCAPGLVFGGIEGVGFRFNVLRAYTRFRRYRGCRVPFSCFAIPDTFSAVPRTSGPIFMFCAPGLVFDGAEGVGSRFHVLRSRTRFRRYRGRRFPFPCFALPELFSAVSRASDPVLMFCAPGLIFGDTVGVSFRFHVLRAWTRFRRYRGRRVPFQRVAPLDSFSAVSRASGSVLMFCAPILVFGGIEGVGYRFHVLLSWTRFRRYRGRRVPFSCFALPDSFSTVPRASGPVFMFCAPGLIFGGTDGVGSRFHVLRARTRFQRCRGHQSRFHILRFRTHFRRYRGRRFPFQRIALPYSFSAVLRSSGPVFMFCAPRLVFGGTEGVGARFHVLLARTRFRR
jgi:hypothetical protein